jgi:hypothetical protein
VDTIAEFVRRAAGSWLHRSCAIHGTNTAPSDAALIGKYSEQWVLSYSSQLLLCDQSPATRLRHKACLYQMPNWCASRLELRGDEASLLAFQKAAEGMYPTRWLHGVMIVDPFAPPPQVS